MNTKQIAPLLTVAALDGLKDFYTTLLGLEAKYDTDTYLGFSRPGEEAQAIAYMTGDAEWPVADPKGLCWCFHVDDVDAEHDRLRGVTPVIRPLQDNPWGDRSFVVMDPAGVAVYIFQ